MLAWQAGDESAFDRLVEIYAGQVYALVARFQGAARAPEDLVQDVFLRVVRVRGRYQPTARFSTFLYRIVFNLCANARARDQHRPELSLDAPSELPESPESNGDREQREMPPELAAEPSGELERADAIGAVRAAIAALPETQRMALILAKYDELPYAEIARVLDSSEKAVKSLVHRARENLRARLAPFLQEVA